MPDNPQSPYNSDLWAGDTVLLPDGRTAVVLVNWLDGNATLLVEGGYRLVVRVDTLTVLTRHPWDDVAS